MPRPVFLHASSTGDTERRRPIGTGPQRPIDTGPQRPIGEGPQRPIGEGPQRPIDTGPQRPIGTGPQRPIGEGPQRPIDTERRRPIGTGPIGTGPQRPIDTAPQRPIGTGPQRPIGEGPQRLNDTAPQRLNGTALQRLNGTERRRLIGVVHLRALPGAPLCERPESVDPLSRVLEHALADARALAANGCDALIVENFGDVPFHAERVPPETIAAMALVVRAVLDVAGPVPVGVNVLRNDARAALAIAATTGASFVRINVHSGAAVTDQGLVEGRAAETLRERARLAPSVAILADAHVKHATQLSRETLAEAVEDLVLRALADGVIVSGAATGRPPDPEHVREAHGAAHGVPVLVGSGLDEHNAQALLAYADGAIVGTALKFEGRVANAVDPERVRRMRVIFDAVKS